MAVAIKTSRIEFRVTDDLKESIELAASLNDQTVSNYITSIIVKQVELDLAKQQTIKLNNKERDMLLYSLEHPWEPNDALKALFK